MNPENAETVSVKLALFCHCEQSPKYMLLHKGENITEIKLYFFNLPRL